MVTCVSELWNSQNQVQRIRAKRWNLDLES